jgi:hypothetical protein
MILVLELVRGAWGQLQRCVVIVRAGDLSGLQCVSLAPYNCNVTLAHFSRQV